jgi:hypothetical protein
MSNSTQRFRQPIPAGRPASPTQHHILTRYVPVSRRAFMDLAGRFPFKSIGGFEYMLIMFAEDDNYIHVELMRTRGAKEYARAYEQGLTFFRECGICPTWMSLDNKTNPLIATISRECGVRIQYAPHGNHQANAAERAIQTWKDHFILSSYLPWTRISLWRRGTSWFHKLS